MDSTMNIIKISSLLFLMMIVTGCTLVELNSEGEKARVLSASEVTGCKYVGKTTSTTTEKVVGVKRHEKAIIEELESLARNAAHRLGGDTVVAESEIVDGRQSFQVYRCVPQ